MEGQPYDFFVQWHVTEKCNLKCRHCYQGRLAGELGYRETCQGIDNIRSAIESWVTLYGVQMSPSFHFTGGEPVLRKDLFQLMRYAKDHGFSTSLMSNGVLITQDIAQRIADLQPSDVQISLDGLEAVHDSVRGAGSFIGALRGITNLVSQGIDTHVNLTVSRLNVGQLDGLVHLAAQLGISSLGISRLVPCGGGAGLFQEMLSREEIDNLLNRLPSLRIGAVVITSRDPLVNIAGVDGDIPDTDFAMAGCSAGIFGVTVAANGNIMPCRRMNLVIGNIMRDSFRRLWAESPVLNSLRQRDCYHDGCESCLYWPICRGCRAIALASARARGVEDYLGPDPQCPYYRARPSSSLGLGIKSPLSGTRSAKPMP